MKPVVTYGYAYLLPVEGESAVIGELQGHPRQNGGSFTGDAVQTSTVERVEFDANGKVTEFETLNTIYRPRNKETA